MFNIYSYDQRKFWLYWTPKKEQSGFGYYIDTDYSELVIFEFAKHQFIPEDKWGRASV